MRSRTAGDRGSVTAEFATVIPAVVLVLAGCLACVQVAGQQVRLQDAVADASRALARGDAPAARRATSIVPGARLSSTASGDLVCARLTVRSSTPMGAVLGLTLSARSCALGGGE